MRSLIFGDLHDLVDVADAVVNQFGSNYDEIVFVGDYFDSFGGTISNTERTAKWVKEKLNDPKCILLIGNHDLHYFAFRNLTIRGSGYSRNKADTINSILTIEDWRKLRFFYKTQGFIISHAGIGQHLYHPINGLDLDIFQIKCKESFYNLLHGVTSNIFDVGRARGGWLDCGGITWQDWETRVPTYFGA